MDTRDNIMDAVERIIRTRGVGRATIKEIAREAGCAQGSIFNHFDAKDDLMLAVVRERLPAFRFVMETLEEGDVAGNLAGIALAAIRLFESIIPVASSLFSDLELLNRHKKLMLDHAAGPHHLLQKVVDYLEIERQRGSIRPDADLTSITTQLFGACFFWVFTAQTNGINLTPNESEAQFVGGLAASLSKALAPVCERKQNASATA